MMEIWKDIEGYEGLYQVSNYGRVRSLKFGKERIRKPYISGRGYLRVQLWKNNKLIRYLIHRLVAMAFIPNPNKLPFVNHKDENPSNNHVENLEWCTAKYNSNYGSCIQRRAAKQSKTVYQYTMDGEFIREWKSGSEIERQFGYSHSHISACCLGKLKTAYNYKWTY